MLNVYGPNGQRLSSSEEPLEVIGDPTCTHPKEAVRVVEDNSGIPDVVATQCHVCGIGWLTRIN